MQRLGLVLIITFDDSIVHLIDKWYLIYVFQRHMLIISDVLRDDFV